MCELYYNDYENEKEYCMSYFWFKGPRGSAIIGEEKKINIIS